LNSIGWEVSEDTFAALLEACVRSGEAKSASEAIVILKNQGIKVRIVIFQFCKHVRIYLASLCIAANECSVCY
jgi:hypothetical protein